MPHAPFHLAWFLEGSSVHGWNHPWSGAIGRDWQKPDLFIDLARSLERACFDYVLIEDSSYVGESFEGKRDIYLERGISVPRQDPSVVATLLANATSRIGIVPTFGTFAYPPFLLARLVSTLDQVSGGRIGWNMVTGSSDFAARNFGLSGMPEHDLRYEMAEEYMSVVNRLWDSWDADAVVADLRSGRLVDPAKVRSVDFDGRWYKSRGPLNSGPAPQGRPVIAQAGGSPRGRQFAAGHADTIVAMSQGFEGMRAYRDDVRARMRALGRDPDQCKVLFLISPILGASDAEAEAEERRRNEQAAADVSSALAFFGKITNIDFGGYDLDTPVSRLDLHTNGHQQSLDEFRRFAGDRSLRQAMAAFSQGGKSLRLVGGPERIADEMATAMEAVGGDGFLISLPAITRRAMAEIADGLVPALQARGLARREYRHAQFRDNLLDF
ncbi:MAG TPA: NtaA/DmoA family FMN-dependent monooxygenase [Acidisoma sp.]|uniref:NtaA/DmoA family FMN-dependent monooxygenase n=1 Tax=Acidisoma sp. TaxID=1872115 RepID=UPI002D0C8BD6|nr:NtaA/DmoA family FMN-dependent monooxygenase [Acidisoma sp.]HTH99509.1 NtaA/DmoA family FMN-dependent monooxygenase [Acidisoma sp.]